MVTVGLAKELLFISKVLNTELDLTLTANNLTDLTPIYLKIKDGVLNIWYKDQHIWKELIEGDTSMFGIESCDSISRIIVCLNNNDPSWIKYRYLEST